MQRKQHWEEVYRNKSPLEVSWFQVHPEFSLDLIEATGIGKDQPVIDIGGGASRLVDKLLAAGYHDVTVLDIAAAALAHAQERLGNQAAQVKWIESDITAFTPPRRYALWHDRAVFHFLTDPADRAQYLTALHQGLADDGQAIIATFALDGPEKCSNLPVERYDATKLRAVLGADFELVETRGETHRTPANKLQQFMYFRLRKSTG